MSLILQNPHSVLAVLEHRPKDVLSLCLSKNQRHESWDAVAEKATALGLPISWTSAQKNSEGPLGSHRRDNKGKKGSFSRGAIKNDQSLGSVGVRDPQDQSAYAGRLSACRAQVKEKTALSVGELFSDHSASKASSGLWVALDQLQDPQNVGAIFRAASFFGISGILMTQDRSAGLTSSVYDVACGGVESVPFAVCVNLNRAFEEAKQAGLWILGTSEHAHESYRSIPQDRSWLLVLGNEEKGMRRLTAEACDQLCRIPAQGRVTSLNVSVAAGILLATFSAGATS